MADETAKIQILDIPNLVQSFIENHFSKVKDMGYNTSDPYYQNLLKDPIRNYFKISNNTSFFVGAGVKCARAKVLQTFGKNNRIKIRIIHKCILINRETSASLCESYGFQTTIFKCRVSNGLQARRKHN